jgi:ribose transport system substrate-binding protein
MKTRRPYIVISLTTRDSDYQKAEAQAALEAARRHGFDLQIIYAEGDAITQSQQLLNVIQSPGERPDVIMLEPVGTGMVSVARAAVNTGIGWVVLNREVDYMTDLRKDARVPVYAVTTHHLETGRIQGRQINLLLPSGGTVLYLQGPAASEAARRRSEGMRNTLRPNVQIRALNGHWLEHTAFEAVSAWLKLPTSRDLKIDLVAAQNDFMAMGARKAFTESAAVYGKHDWVRIKYLGCDGLKEYGHKWASMGRLAATIVCPTLTHLAIEQFAKTRVTGTIPPTVTYTEPLPYPSLEQAVAPDHRVTA